MKMKKILSSALAAAMLLSSGAFNAYAEETTVAVGGKSVGGAEVLSDGADYSTVYYGGIPWRVLDKEFSDGQDNPTDGLYMLSEYVYGHGTYWNAHYGPGDYVWGRKGIFTRLDVQYHENGYMGDPGNTSPTNLGYQESDIRKYMTGIGDYEAVYPRSMHEHGNPDDSGLNVSSYFWKTKVTDEEPVPGVDYYIKGDFKLSNDENNNYTTLSVDASSWLPDTWYTYDAATDTFNLVEEAPAPGETLTCYHDATEYYKVGQLDSFEDGVDYYTFEKISAGMPEWEYTKLEMQANSIAKGALYVGFTVTDMKESTSADVEGEGRVILSGTNDRNFASDMGFSEAEQAAVLPVNRVGYTNGGAKRPSVWTYKNSGAYSDEFVNDTYFLPTAADLNTYLDDNGISKAATFANGDSAQYWLSSLLRYDRAGMVDGGGGEWYQHPTMKHLGIRPAFVLNPEAVQFYAPVEDMEFAVTGDNAENAYKLTLKDGSRNLTVNSVTTVDGKKVVSYSGAETGENEYISAVICNADGSIYAYGKAGKVTGESGEVEIDVTGCDLPGKTMYVFNEQCNGDGQTNYAGNLVSIYNPAGDLQYAGYVGKSGVEGTADYRENIQVDLYDLNANESVTVELYSDGTLLSTTTLRDGAVARPVLGTLTANIVVYGKESSSWDTVWHTYPDANKLPDMIKLYADGALVDTWDGGFINDEEEDKFENLTAVTEFAKEVKLTFEATDDANVYDIYLESTDGYKINRLSAVEGKFDFIDLNGEATYELSAADGVTLMQDIDDEKVYEFNLSPDATDKKIKLGKVTFTATEAEFGFGLVAYDETTANTAELEDNIVYSYVPGGDVNTGNKFNVDASRIDGGVEIEEETTDVKVVIDFNNKIKAGNDADYNDMEVTLTGSNGDVYKGYVGKGTNNGNEYYFENTAEKVEMTFNVKAGYRYTVVVKGEGYRTARYTTVVDDATTLKFWNNAMANEKNEPVLVPIEEKLESSKRAITFLAGDIALDNKIDKYDLAAVVAYFGYDADTEASNGSKINMADYVKYDLNRDGRIDADDISYVLVSWDK